MEKELKGCMDRFAQVFLIITIRLCPQDGSFAMGEGAWDNV
jgi:hypothetical protein